MTGKSRRAAKGWAAMWMVIMAGQLGAGATRAATYEAPLDVRKDGDVKFAAPPKATVVGDEVKITFAVSAPTDVEVAVLNADGKVVRHLAAGLLGKNAPEPFKKDALAQEVSWDRKDDAGNAAAGGPFKVRVLAGLRPRLEKYVGFDGNTFGGFIKGLVVGKDGELLVLLSDFAVGRSSMRVLDKDGKYLRTIMPYPANTPKERTDSLGAVEIDGERVPIMISGWTGAVYPLTCGLQNQTMAWHPKGYVVLVSAAGSMTEHGGPRHLLAMHPEGGAPEGVGFIGPRFRKGRAKTIGADGEAYSDYLDHLAISPDGRWFYMTRYARSKKEGLFTQRHGVFRAKWTDAEANTLFLGQDQPGAGDGQFDDPEGLAVDKAGNLYVCDRGNNRVCIFSPEGKLLDKFPVETPELIAVHQVTGEIYVSSKKKIVTENSGTQRHGNSTLLKFAAWGPGKPAPKELARLVNVSVAVMALDPTAQPARLWVAGRTAPPSLTPVIDRGSALEPGQRVDNDNGLRYPFYAVGDAARNRILCQDGDRIPGASCAISSLDLATGKREAFCKGAMPALDRDGNVLTLDGYGTNSVSRYDPAGKPLPFAATGTSTIKTRGYRAFGNLRGLCVRANGDIYLLRTNDYGGPVEFGGRVDVIGPDGRIKKADLIGGAGYGDCGLGVDAAGNVYMGVNVKPADRPLPAAFMGKVPAKNWSYWPADQEREVPWRYVHYNSYLWHYGAVMKFSPAGGGFYGQHPWKLKEAGYCFNSLLAVDDYGRVFAPDVFRFAVEVLDTNGNQIARIGRYGNSDSPMPRSGAPDPPIAFAFPAHVSVDGDKVFVMDSANRRLVVVTLDAAASAECAAP